MIEDISLHAGLERMAQDAANLVHLLGATYDASLDDKDRLDALLIIARDHAKALESLADACVKESFASRRAAA